MRKGTTLIEVLLYTVIAGVFVTTITIFAWNAISAKKRSDSQIDVNNAVQIAIEEIEKSIRNADSISVPATKGQSTNSLGLNLTDGSSRTFDLFSGKIRMISGSSTYFLSPDGVVVEELSFTNLSRSGTPGAVGVHLKAKRVNTQNLKELSAESEINTTVSLRN